MKRRTTTKKINDAITNNLVKLTKAEVYHKTSRKTEVIDNIIITENLLFLCESGVFVDCIGWTFERDYKANSYIAECGRREGDSENIVTVYLCAGDGVEREFIDRALSVIEEE